MKERYIAWMEAALSAYSNEHLAAFVEEEKREGISDHSFARLTSNIGILISHGRRRDLLPIFLEMMDFCCYCTPRFQIESDFSVREIVNCLQAVEDAGVVDAERIKVWRKEIASIEPYSCYRMIAKDPDEVLFNWALFTAVSEYRRNVAGLGDTAEIIDIQLATQLKHLDENGMYRDAVDSAPMLYDLVSRGLFSILLRLGYSGKYRNMLDGIIKNAALLSLKMQSVTGEIPFGGRSNQFIHNEAWLAVIFEYEAARYAREGNAELAGKYKAAVYRALERVDEWLTKDPIYHIKNRFPTETKYGCEKYAHFNGYMIAVASVLYEAYLSCDDSIAAGEFDTSPVAWQSSEYFHTVFLRAGGYSLEFDTNADPRYDANGLGRVHREGAPSPICLSMPCTSQPKYEVDIEKPFAFSVGSALRTEEGWHFAAEETAKYEMLEIKAGKDTAWATFLCGFENKGAVKEYYTINENGVAIEVKGDGEIAFTLPAFCFDGEITPEITADKQCLVVFYKGWSCRYTTDGTILDLDQVAANRNGHYRVFAATAQNTLNVRIEIVKKETV